MSSTTGARKAADDITVRERLVFAAGDIYAGGASSLIAVLYLIFLTDIVRLSPGLAGTAVLVAKLWDSVNDPLMGAISDRTRTRLGRRRPWILAGAILLIPIMALLWLPFPVLDSQIGRMVWTMVSYIAYNTVQTIMAVPYASMSTEITADYGQRNKVNTTRLLFSTVASASVTLLASWLFDQYRSDGMSLSTMYASIVLGFGVVFTACMLGVALFCRERVPVPREIEPFRVKTFVQPLGIPSFRRAASAGDAVIRRRRNTQPAGPGMTIKMAPPGIADLDRLLAGNSIDEAAVVELCDFVDARHDCADFRALTLLRIAHSDNATISAGLRERIRTTLLGFRYWMDEAGTDSMCFWSENHQVIFAVAEYLAGQLYPRDVFTNPCLDGHLLSGGERMDRARRRLETWLEHRFRFGFTEWCSNTYLRGGCCRPGAAVRPGPGWCAGPPGDDGPGSAGA